MSIYLDISYIYFPFKNHSHIFCLNDSVSVDKDPSLRQNNNGNKKESIEGINLNLTIL